MPVKPKSQTTRPAKVGATGRKQAPKLSVVDEYYQDESVLIKNRAKAALGEAKAAGMDFLYGAPESTNTAESLSLQGWVPVVTEDENGNKKRWRHKTDPLLMRPKGQSERSHNMAAEVARDQLRNTLAAKGEDGFAPE